MKNIFSFLILALGLATTLLVSANYPAGGETSGSNVLLGWDTPNERVDGSSLLPSEIGGYKLYENGFLAYELPFSNEFLYESEGYGRICFTISTVDIYDQEGPQSPEYCHLFKPAAPGSPQSFGKLNPQ